MKHQLRNTFVVCVAIAMLAQVACSDDPVRATPPTADTGTDTVTQQDTSTTPDTVQDTATEPDAPDETDTPLSTDIAQSDVVEGDVEPGDTSEPEDAGDTSEPGDDASEDASEDVGDPGLVGDTCADAFNVTAGGTWANQTTTGYTDSYSAKAQGNSGCPVALVSGPDRVYSVSPAVATSYQVTVVPTGTYDPLLYVRLDCAANACIAGTKFNGPGQQEQVSFSVAAGQTAFIIVDGDGLTIGGQTHGDFTLTVTATLL
ncbi:MAG: hypothetical protein H0U74_08385 [Bradymonadaceae bacterium]|nr:hypothetical protein [Lujinxingiaceae bacterium]